MWTPVLTNKLTESLPTSARMRKTMSWTAVWPCFLPNSLKVYLRADVQVAAARILSDPNRNSEQYQTREEAVEKITARKASENARFLKTTQTAPIWTTSTLSWIRQTTPPRKSEQSFSTDFPGFKSLYSLISAQPSSSPSPAARRGTRQSARVLHKSPGSGQAPSRFCTNNSSRKWPAPAKTATAVRCAGR